MARRLILIIAVAALLVPAVAAAASAGTAASAAVDPYATPLSYGWVLQLRSAAHDWDMRYVGFRTFAGQGARVDVVDPGKLADDPSDDTAGSGIPLYRIVGRIDDNDPSTFNVKRATTAPGYNVEVIALDGFTATFTGAEVASLGDALVVCDRVGGHTLNLGSASIKNPMTVDEYASWKPTWPLRLLSSDPTITGKRKPSGIVRVRIVPAVAATGQAAPLEATSADEAPAGGWTLTLVGKLRKVMPIATVPTKVVWDGTKAGNINPSLRYVYRGQSLYKLLGKVDDSNPAGFNAKKAKRGYTIKFICRDGYKPTMSSRRLFYNGKPRRGWIIARLKAGAPLQGDEAPFRFVGSFIKPFNAKLSAYGIVKIKLIF